LDSKEKCWSIIATEHEAEAHELGRSCERAQAWIFFGWRAAIVTSTPQAQASKQAIIKASSIVATNNETQYNRSQALTTRRPGLFHRRRYFVRWIPADDHV
jgi:hypothetical protein